MNKNKVLSVGLSLAMAMTTVPAMGATAFAADDSNPSSVTTEVNQFEKSGSAIKAEIAAIQALNSDATTDAEGAAISERGNSFLYDTLIPILEEEQLGNTIEIIINTYDLSMEDIENLTAEGYLAYLNETLLEAYNDDVENWDLNHSPDEDGEDVGGEDIGGNEDIGGGDEDIDDDIPSVDETEWLQVTKVEVKADSVVYNGKAQTPEIAVFDGDGLEMADGAYDITFSNNVDVGTATVKVVGKQLGENKYEGEATATFAILPSTATKAEIADVTYTGKAQSPKPAVYDQAGNLIPSSVYKVTYKNNTKAGTATATIKVSGKNYTTKTIAQTFKVVPAKVNKISMSNVTYNGKTQKPKVKVYDENGKTVPSSSYSVSYKNNKYVGTATATVTAKKGNYQGSVSKTFTISPVKTSITSMSKATKAFTIKWSKKSSQVTGYEIQYSTDKKFSNAETIVVPSYKTTSKKISNLSAKKTYYAKVRTYKTVNDTKYYSSWSSVKSVKTK